MKPQYQHEVLTSFILWFDNHLLTKGEAFSNKTGTFHFFDDSRLPDYDAFASPYKQFVMDSSVTGAIIKSGISGFDLPTYKVSDNDSVRSFSATLKTGVLAPFTEVTTGFFKVTGDLISGGENYKNDWVSFEPDYTDAHLGKPSNGEFLRFNLYSSNKFQLYYHLPNAVDQDGNATNEFFKLSPSHPYEIFGYPWGGAYNSNDNSDKRIKRFFDPKDSGGALIDNDLFWVNSAIVDFENGRIIETGGYDYSEGDVITGTFAVKDFNIYVSDETEEDLILESKFIVNSRYNDSETGVKPYDKVVPAVFINTEGIQNVPYAFGGEDETRTSVKAVVLAENNYQLDGVLSIFADSTKKFITPIPFTGYPTTEYGDLKDGGFNYTGLIEDYSTSNPYYIEDVIVSKLSEREKPQQLGEVKVGFIDFDLRQARFPRL